MKTKLFNYWLALGATLLVTSAVLRASADEPAPASRRYEHYTGTVVSVDPQEHVLKVQGWFLFKKTSTSATPAFISCGKNLTPRRPTCGRAKKSR